MRIIVADQTGSVESVELASMRTRGLPRAAKRTRLVHISNPSKLERVHADEYLAAFGIALPSSLQATHQVFRFQDEQQRHIYIPALAFMRAFFQPFQQVFPIAFTPGNVDLLSYIDFSGTAPEVVVDDDQLRKQINDPRCSKRPYEVLRWLQLSRSAKHCAHSVHLNALDGRIDLSLPDGLARFALHGLRTAHGFFVEQVTLLSIETSADDSVAGQPEQFFFHAGADFARPAQTSAPEIVVPQRAGGHVRVTDSEWEVIGPLLETQERRRPYKHDPRTVLDAILHKLAFHQAWRTTLPQESTLTVHVLKSCFRRWSIRGSFDLALSHLRACRTSC
ncbi:MAG: transposase [Comamonas sp.]|jgi:hypothetical protein|nr:transposase [Comamonas sp.]